MGRFLGKNPTKSPFFTLPLECYTNSLACAVSFNFRNLLGLANPGNLSVSCVSDVSS